MLGTTSSVAGPWSLAPRADLSPLCPAAPHLPPSLLPTTGSCSSPNPPQAPPSSPPPCTDDPPQKELPGLQGQLGATDHRDIPGAGKSGGTGRRGRGCGGQAGRGRAPCAHGTLSTESPAAGQPHLALEHRPASLPTVPSPQPVLQRQICPSLPPRTLLLSAPWR